MRPGLALPLALLLAACERTPEVTFADVAISLPDDPARLPPGPGMETVAENCTACHSPAMMLQQPRLPRATWEGIIDKMITVYKAPVDRAAAPVIVDYLMAMQDTRTTAGELPPGP
jgi:hypothetical protein